MIRSAMLRGLSGETLGMALDSFDCGDLRPAAQLWQPMCLRDDSIANVKPKREKSVSRRDWQVLTSDGSAEAKRQQKILTDFWNSVRAVDAYDLNVRGGFSRLVRQMMESVSFKYAAHHLVWHPSRDGLRCTFEYVPLHFFENRTGRLQFCPTGMEYEGVPMAEDEWLVTVGDGLMFAGSIGYWCKRNVIADWMAFSDKFGMPGLLGKTSQGQDSEGGRAMAEAVGTFGQDWAAVLYGDDGSGKIELISPGGSSTNLPMPALADRVDRRLSALWRGADLSSMSSLSGTSTGANLQGEESDLIEQDDALTISEKLNEIDEQVLRWWFGPRVKVRAYIRLIVPQSEDLRLLLNAISTLVRLGAPIAINDVLERFGFATPKKGDALLTSSRGKSNGGQSQSQDPNADPEAEPDETTQLNASLSDEDEEQFLAAAARLLAKASQKDRVQLVEDLKEVLRAPEDKLIEAVAGFLARLPENIGEDAAQVKAWEDLIGSALINGWAGKQA